LTLPVNIQRTLQRISDAASFSAERSRNHSTIESAVAHRSATSAVRAETPRTLTFAELQTAIEQGKTDDIPNNKDIPDVLNVSFSSLVLDGI
jgi:hypothetical protein